MNISVSWDDSDDKHDNNEIHSQVVDNGNFIAYPTFLTCGNSNFDVFELENSDENQCNQEQDEFYDPTLEDLYAQTLAKCMKLEKKVNDVKEKMKSTLDEFRLAKLDVVLSQQKLVKFYHGAKNIDKMLCMRKTDSDKRGLGYEESLSSAKTPQITKFVKATAATSFPKHNIISTTHDHAQRVSCSQIYYYSLCGRKGHIASYCRFVGPYQSYVRPFDGYQYNSNAMSTNVKRENVFRWFAQETTGRRTLQSIWRILRTIFDMARVKRLQEDSSIPNPTNTAKRGRTNRGTWTGPSRTLPRVTSEAGRSNAGARGHYPPNWETLKSSFKFLGYQKEVTLHIAQPCAKYHDISTIFEIFNIHGWTGIMEPKMPFYSRLVQLFYATLRVVQAFGLGEPVDSDVPPLEWPPVLLEFPPKEVMEESLLFRKGRKNVLVGNMIYLVYLYAKGLSVDLALIILHEMFATENSDHQTRLLPYSRFIAQILTDMGYMIRPDEEIGGKNEVINSRYWEKRKKHMIPVLESEIEGDAADSGTESIPARRAARLSTSRTAPTDLPGPSASAPTELVPQDFDALHSYIETRFTRMETQIKSQFHIFTDALSRLQTFMDALSSGPPAPDRDEQS
ncbi:hypothetical protein GIB67_041509 [Kingdonia uniflora]|uniref:Uncharacterized protein n=1 Tax=Kingdonia uniflora TaxID=39325 RepID=A0A7J7MQP7_9MAGN|nr:hypothetical protein GIB67_041509 [Kingdonia uniflora]